MSKINYKHGDKLHVIATQRVTIKPGFHASGSEVNRNYPGQPEILKAEVIPCGTTWNTSYPWVRNLNSGSSYLEQFWTSMGYKIGESFETIGPWALNRLSGGGEITEESSAERVSNRSYLVTGFKNRINVKSLNSMIRTIILYSVDGKELKSIEISDDTREVNLYDLRLSAGVYYMVINDSYSSRFVAN